LTFAPPPTTTTTTTPTTTERDVRVVSRRAPPPPRRPAARLPIRATKILCFRRGDGRTTSVRGASTSPNHTGHDFLFFRQPRRTIKLRRWWSVVWWLDGEQRGVESFNSHVHFHRVVPIFVTSRSFCDILFSSPTTRTPGGEEQRKKNNDVDDEKHSSDHHRARQTASGVSRPQNELLLSLKENTFFYHIIIFSLLLHQQPNRIPLILLNCIQ
jgi:hypothetical protein